MTTTTLEVPARSPEQRMTALKKANHVRYHRAWLKRDLKAGRVTVHDLVLDPPDWLETAKVFDLLLAVPKFGRVKVARILGDSGVSWAKTVGGLTDRQRIAVVSYLRTNARRS